MVGIYCIHNLINDKRYIGKSKSIESRTHGINENIPGFYRNQHLTRAIEKYGIENFSLEILEGCSIEDLNEREKYWIVYYKSYDPAYGYNKTFGGDGGTPTDEIREKLSKSHLGNKARLGSIHTEEELKKISEGCKRWHQEVGFSEDARKRMSQPGELNGNYGHKYVHRIFNDSVDRASIPADQLEDFLNSNPDYKLGYGPRGKWVHLKDSSGKLIDQRTTLNYEYYISIGYSYGMGESGRTGKLRGKYRNSKAT